ncbi:MAG: galactonate dehydratase [Gammaproteobacteria bacterium]|jgi:galactonate dehydratase|nr:galactonate dehydratase [Gammaproteobacteria bacterium]MDB9797942.1 galactonate dehydratase [Pseudomonadales bacterium]MBT5333139.1 galactonate dehydratase [Gammaproteobacteria bacterium]MBT5680657.1 galactonate dehydratase [Gammaproteobacteria bacterium]MBT6025370.1 galactonate dehydratase [Gammaproteobacteria bacterium]
MKITKITTYIVPPRWLFLKIETDEGIFGWGEPVIEGRAHTVAAAVDELSDYLIGQDPLQIEKHWQAMYRGAFYRGGPILMSAIAGVDQALWDIKGKYHDAPVHQLLGGQVRDRIRVYAWVGGDRPDAIVASAKAAIAGGFKATKMNITEEMQIVDTMATVDQAVERMASLREAVGNKLDIAVDFHGRVHAPMARVLIKALEPYSPFFIEEPVLSEHLEAMAELRKNTHIPIATGERLFSRFDYKRVFTLGAADIIQPDLSHAGGITECKKIADMAEAWDIGLAPHCPLGPIALAACLQVDAVCQNAFIQEQSQGIHYNQSNDLTDYLVDPSVFHYKDGYVDIPQKPGLGIEIDEEVVIERAKIGHRWRNPLWNHADGSIAEW